MEIKSSHYLIGAAKQIAMTAHAGQLYAGKDYFKEHVLPVAVAVEKAEGSLVEITLALLHDVVEDSEMTYSDVEHGLEKACGRYLNLHKHLIKQVMDGLKCITKVKGEDYDLYIQRVKSNSLAREVKFHDSTCNMNRCIKDKDYKRAKKYLKVLIELS
jgi:(p)ppGpp synthase/HD superfamily hydrolase